MFRKIISSALALIAAGCFTLYAQMSDEAVVEYIAKGVAAGKSQSQIGNELLAKGVTVSQAKRLMQTYKNGQNSDDMSSSASTKRYGIGGVENDPTSSRYESRFVKDRKSSSSKSSKDSRGEIDGKKSADFDVDYPDVEKKSKSTQKSSRKSKVSKTRKSGELDEFGEEEMDEEEEEDDEIQIYGHDLFDNEDLTFEPNESAATPAGYVIGPGDQIIIDVWGENEVAIKQTVTPEGVIIISQIGPVNVSGMTIEQATAKLKSVLSRKYSLSGSGASSNISVTLGKIRTVKVNVLGEVNQPGTYRLSSLTTVFNALYSAAGVTPIGSLRNIQVIRAGKQIATADIYRMIFEGTDGGNVSLTDGDAIVVPPYSALVEADGGVKRPMFYEILPGEPLEKVLQYAGGFVSNAHPGEVMVQRMDGSNGKVFTVQSGQFSSFGMQDGDVLSVYTNSQEDFFSNRVQIKGSVLRPGVYEFGKEIATVRQLVEHAGGLLEDAFTSRAQLVREKSDRTLEMQSVAIGAIMNGTSEDIMLRKNDMLIVSKVSEIERKGDLSITGYVLQPGDYEYAENMTVEDLILLAGGLESGASTARVDISRRIVNPSSTSASDTLAQVFSFSISDSLAVDKGAANFTLQPYDVVSVRRSPTYVEQRRIRVSGEATFPGEYTLISNEEHLSDIIKRAGGPTTNGYVGGAMLKRKVTEDERNVRRNMVNLIRRGGNSKDSTLVDKLKINEIYTVGIDLTKALANPHGVDDIVLHDGDEIIIPSRTSTVRIQGEVMYPNSVSYLPGKNVKYYVHQAGGYSNNAKRAKVYVVYMNGKVAVGAGAKILPGCEVIVPSRAERQKMGVAEWLGIGTTAASITTMLATISNLIKR